MPKSLVLGIESSCDETSAAIVEDGYRVLANEVASQTLLHAPMGGGARGGLAPASGEHTLPRSRGLRQTRWAGKT